MKSHWGGPLEPAGKFRWRIPKSYQPGMRTDGIVFADDRLLAQLRQGQAPQQVVNVAHLPGLVGASMAMPDVHWGYGFPIGGVAAVDAACGVISPGGVGYDINCGVRLLRTDLIASEIQSRVPKLVRQLFQNIPCGVGASGPVKLSEQAQKAVLREGAGWAVDNGFGWPSDLEYTEAQGAMAGADPETLSPRALERGRPQLGTLGSGNHFLEIQVVDAIFDTEAAAAFGLFEGQVTVMIHTGSRGLGYQVCDDSLDTMVGAMHRYHIQLPDAQLACAPVQSPEGRQYFAAMAAAANYAWANRQLIAHGVRNAFSAVLNQSPEAMGMQQVYDVAHNIAKFERHHHREVLVHRKGATRAFGPGHADLPEGYRSVGQPVLIPGDMGTASYVLVGTEAAMVESFGSTCHGAGRVMSRHAAVKATRGRSIAAELEKQGICVMSRGRKTLFEEAPEAYKNIDDVVNVVQGAGLSKRVARLRPMGVVKG